MSKGILRLRTHNTVRSQTYARGPTFKSVSIFWWVSKFDIYQESIDLWDMWSNVNVFQYGGENTNITDFTFTISIRWWWFWLGSTIRTVLVCSSIGSHVFFAGGAAFKWKCKRGNRPKSRCVCVCVYVLGSFTLHRTQVIRNTYAIKIQNKRRDNKSCYGILPLFGCGKM